MQFNHQPASHAFTSALLRLLQRTEVMLQRRVDVQALALEPDDMSSVEVQDTDFYAWLEAGGDLLMGGPSGLQQPLAGQKKAGPQATV